MKVIIIKDCKDGKINQVVDVANGYGTNFLIRQGFALPYNSQTKHILSQKLAKIKSSERAHDQEVHLLKAQIEKTELIFSLKVTNDIVHGSITRKQIQHHLKQVNINLNSNQIENIRINTLGVTKVKIMLDKKTTALLKIKVIKDGK